MQESNKWLPCFDAYREEKQRSFSTLLEVDRANDIDAARRERRLTPYGESMFRDAVLGYLCGCRDEANELAAEGYEFLKLATELGEKQANLYTPGFTEARRSAALSFLHWLQTGETLDRELVAGARHYAEYFASSKTWDRGSANIAAPDLIYLGARDAVMLIAKKLYGKPGAPAKPGGLFGDALRIASAADTAERDQLKAKVRKRLGLQLFRWVNQGHYDSVAFMLHAVYPKPAGARSALIEAAWTHMPEIERVPGYLAWNVKRRK
jgi:hypothetical protein